MNEADRDNMKELKEAIEKLDGRMRALENAISSGRGAFQMFLWILGAIGTIMGAIKIFGK
jgi:hypothetical protein